MYRLVGAGKLVWIYSIKGGFGIAGLSDLQSLRFGVANDRHFSVQQPSPLQLSADGNPTQPQAAKKTGYTRTRCCGW